MNRTSYIIGFLLFFCGATAFISSGPSRASTRADFTLDAYSDMESGVRRLRDGTYEVAGLVRMPGVTAAMFRWWFTDYLETTEHYKMWHPVDHVWMDWEHKRPSEIVGAHHLVHEYIGGEMNRLRIQFVDPEIILGYDPTDENTEAICARAAELDTGMNIAEMCHVARNTPSGMELRSRFWMGVVSDPDAGPVRSFFLSLAANNPVTRRLAVDKANALALLRHCTEEMSYLANLLPGIYPK